MNKQEIEELFSVGDTLRCQGEETLTVADILDDRVLLRPAAADAGEISLEYGAIADALAGGDAGKAAPFLGHFIAEYQRRAQIRHEERVDELWDSAAELFLGPVCSMPEPTSPGTNSLPLCPLDASFFLNRR